MKAFYLIFFTVFSSCLFAQSSLMPLDELKAYMIGDKLNLYWATDVGINTKYPFAIQRSFDASMWEQIGTMPIKLGWANYTFIDSTLQGFYPNLYYRLRQEKEDAFAAVSEILALKNTDFEIPTPTLYPNPVEATAFLRYTPPQGTWVKIKIFDVIGRQRVELDRIDNPHEDIKIDVSALETGIFFFTIKTKEGVQSIKFLKN